MVKIAAKFTSAILIITEPDNFYGTSPGIDKVEVTIKPSFLSTKLFTHLKVAITP